MNMNPLISAVGKMRSHAEGLADDADRAQLKVSVGSLQFEAAGGPDESVSDLRAEFETLFRNLHEQVDDVEADSSEDLQEQIENTIAERNEKAIDQTSRNVY